MDDVCERIQKLIDAEDGATYRSVSLKAGLSTSMMHKFMTRKTETMRLPNLAKVADALGVSLSYLLYGDGGHEQVVRLWDHIPDVNKPHALKILSTFIKDGTDG